MASTPPALPTAGLWEFKGEENRNLFQHGVEPAVSLLLLQKMQKDLLQLQGSDSHANYMISARSEVLNNQVKPEETMMVSSLVWSAVKAKEQPRGVFHVQLLPLLMAAGLQDEDGIDRIEDSILESCDLDNDSGSLLMILAQIATVMLCLQSGVEDDLCPNCKHMLASAAHSFMVRAVSGNHLNGDQHTVPASARRPCLQWGSAVGSCLVMLTPALQDSFAVLLLLPVGLRFADKGSPENRKSLGPCSGGSTPVAIPMRVGHNSALMHTKGSHSWSSGSDAAHSPGGHTTQEVHKYRNSVPREHRQPERQQHSSFPEPDTANLRIDTTEDPTEGSLSTPSDASAPFSSEKHWVAISQSRMHGKEEQQLVDAPLARGTGLQLAQDTYMLAVMASGLFLHQYCKVQHLAGRTNVASPGSRLRQGPCAIHTTSAVEMFLLGYGKVIPAGDKSLCSPRRDVPACQQQEMVDTAGCGCQRVRSAPRALSTTMLLAHLAYKASTACLRVLTVGAGPPHSNKTSKSIRKCSHPTPGANQNLE
ncbi:hypothetical protein Anapl_13377 [Anas platyrhynchos]|uniref:Uncharacterized protein n=1 Tax=Anas platyrhynchos TaxID=8839 RepID=R0LIG1_ANAPL|nr:hypothetical protein Anapl_13377 [Anas platyrhynchos]